MASRLAEAIRILVAGCYCVVSVHDLLTKSRVELENGYFLDLYYNDSRGSYSYSLIYDNKRIAGWDNAPHHPELHTHPHHFHAEDGAVVPSRMTGDPPHDMSRVIEYIDGLMSARG